MSSRCLTFPVNQDVAVVVPLHTKDDLPAHIKGVAYWVNHANSNKNSYCFEDGQGGEWPIEFINNDCVTIHLRTSSVLLHCMRLPTIRRGQDY